MCVCVFVCVFVCVRGCVRVFVCVGHMFYRLELIETRIGVPELKGVMGGDETSEGGPDGRGGCSLKSGSSSL